MAIELHNFTWEEERLVQVETQPHHIAGVLAEIRDTLENSDCEWEDVYSAYYEYEEDKTITFYEGESAEAGNPGIWTYVVYNCTAGEEEAEAGNPGIWTYVVYNCTAGEEEVVTNLDINTLDPVLQLRKLASV